MDNNKIISFLNSNLFLRIFNLLIILILILILVYFIIRLENIFLLLDNNNYCALCEQFSNAICIPGINISNILG